MEYFLKIFGGFSVEIAAIAIAAIVFLVNVYKVIEKHYKEKAIREYRQSEEIKAVIEQAKQYPTWHKHSLNAQDRFQQIVTKLEDKIDDLQRSSSEGMAYTWRYRILRFDDEIRHDNKHTKEHFDQILEDITEYERYCEEHPDYPNNKAVFAIKNIKNVYQQCTEEGTFL